MSVVKRRASSCEFNQHDHRLGNIPGTCPGVALQNPYSFVVRPRSCSEIAQGPPNELLISACHLECQEVLDEAFHGDEDAYAAGSLEHHELLVRHYLLACSPLKAASKG